MLPSLACCTRRQVKDFTNARHYFVEGDKSLRLVRNRLPHDGQMISENGDSDDRSIGEWQCGQRTSITSSGSNRFGSFCL
jgi:hypothetical protein